MKVIKVCFPFVFQTEGWMQKKKVWNKETASMSSPSPFKMYPNYQSLYCQISLVNTCNAFHWAHLNSCQCIKCFLDIHNVQCADLKTHKVRSLWPMAVTHGTLISPLLTGAIITDHVLAPDLCLIYVQLTGQCQNDQLNWQNKHCVTVLFI